MLTMLFINGKCTSDKIQDLFDVFKMVLMDINFEDSQSILQNALKSSLSSKKSNVASRGHSYVNTRIRGRYSVRCKSDIILINTTYLSIYSSLIFSCCICITSFH
jgi:Zn-dependent M16 (insulinase) family peptidase